MAAGPGKLGARILLLAALAFLSGAQAFAPLTAIQADAIKELVNEAFNDQGNHLMATVLRLAFHDCVGGSCDGCLNLDFPPNFGLKPAVDMLEDIYINENLDAVLSRADFWQLATVATLERATLVGGRRGQPARPEIILPFRSGPPDCATSPTTTATHTFPHPHDIPFEYFATNFGFDEREVVALMGAHTLGRATETNSGWDGQWSRDPNRLNNDFYRQLLRPWQQVNVGSEQIGDRFQWVDPGRANSLMLPSDAALLVDITPDEITGESACVRFGGGRGGNGGRGRRDFPPSPPLTGNRPPPPQQLQQPPQLPQQQPPQPPQRPPQRPPQAECLPASTAAIVREFAGNNGAWLSAFEDVFTKMSEHGATSLSPLA